MRKLIRDDGKLRDCPANKAVLGYWGTLKEFHGYKKVICTVDWIEALDAVKFIFFLCCWIALFPILPFLQCYFDVHDAKKLVANEKQRMSGHE